jgi:hypothetical protein
MFVSVSQVPEVSPGTVIVLYSHVFAELIVYVDTYDRDWAEFIIEVENVPVKLERTQNDRVTADAPAVPNAKSTQFVPSTA